MALKWFISEISKSYVILLNISKDYIYIYIYIHRIYYTLICSSRISTIHLPKVVCAPDRQGPTFWRSSFESWRSTWVQFAGGEDSRFSILDPFNNDMGNISFLRGRFFLHPKTTQKKTHFAHEMHLFPKGLVLKNHIIPYYMDNPSPWNMALPMRQCTWCG